jgi:hypothetical protein
MSEKKGKHQQIKLIKNTINIIENASENFALILTFNISYDIIF